MSDLDCDLLVIGGGPGGYVCAIRAGQLGLNTVLVEERHLGGTCLNVGCIPSKALIHAAERFHDMTLAAKGDDAMGLACASPSIDLARWAGWKDGIVARLTGGVGALLKRAGVNVLEGTAAILDGKTAEVGGRRVRARTLVIATGSARVELRDLPMGGKVIGSREALSLREVPARLAVIGAGYIGMEIGTAFAKMGSEVTVIEAGDRALPLYDAALVKPVVDRLPALGIDLRLNARAEGLDEAGRLRLTDGETLDADVVLVAAGRRPRTEGLGALDLAMDGPFVRVDDRCATSMRGVFAVGDVTGEPLLAHRAMAQGAMVAEIAAGHRRRWDAAVPAVCFTDPEIVAVGAGPDAEGAVTGRFPFRANGRAMTLGREDGFVRVVARASDHAVIGIQAAGAGVAEMASAFAGLVEMGARLEDVAAVVQAHPTQSEGLQEAALAALGRGLHA